jgi:hypothetical protein
MRILHLYRPRLPGQRAQAIQVVHMCHALAVRGHQVTLLADRGETPPRSALGALSALGLEPVPGLHLEIAPLAQTGLAGLWFRARLAAWWRGEPGVVLARDKRRLLAACQRHGRTHRVVLETHELDSALDQEAGRDPAASLTLEAAVLPLADALVANCGGTLECWEEAHGQLPATRVVAHNATSPARQRHAHPAPDPVVRCVGSLRSFKGLDTILAHSDALGLPLEIVGGRDPSPLVQPPLPFPEVPDLLARSQVLLLPLADNLFGRRLTSPLKLWDYLATAVPIVAPALPSIDEISTITGARFHRYTPGDCGSLVTAVTAAAAAPPRTPFLRTWSQRAAALEALF